MDLNIPTKEGQTTKHGNVLGVFTKTDHDLVSHKHNLNNNKDEYERSQLSNEMESVYKIFLN